MIPLPIDGRIPEIAAAAGRGHLVVVAPPGSGKTTRVPPALVSSGPVILLQPRRIAARSLARRIAEERGWTPGEEVGWQVRFDRRFSARTRLLVVTEGILTARLQSDPLLSEFRTVVLDEFHERSIHADLGIALVRQVAKARDDLRIVVMSATLDARRVAGFLGGCPVIEVEGRPHRVEISHQPALSPRQGVLAALERSQGNVLCFLPGAGEIRRLHGDLGDLRGVEVHELHGMQPPEEQDAAIAPSDGRKVILATNIAETSLTVEGVTAIVDSGQQKVLRYDAARGIDRLETERIAADSAEQRAGRAGRTAPGIAIRLWDARDILRAHREPEIARIDLAGPLLDILGWGEDPARFEWFEPPAPERVEAAMELLAMLGATSGGKLTESGERMHRLPLHPRLARVLLSAGATREASIACAILSEGRRWLDRSEDETSDSDVLLLIDRFGKAPAAVKRAAAEIERLARALLLKSGATDRGGAQSAGTGAQSAPIPSGAGEAASGKSREPRDDGSIGALCAPVPAIPRSLLRAIFDGYPDRVAKRREPGSPRMLLASGHGAVLARESSVRSADYLVALDLAGGEPESLVRLASAIDPEWVEPTRSETVHIFDVASGSVRAKATYWYMQIAISERDVRPDPAAAEKILAAELSRMIAASGDPLMRRLRFAGVEVDLDALAASACAGRTRLPRLHLEQWIDGAARQKLGRLAPEELAVPSGRRIRLEYREDGSVVAPVKLQELFGLAETPRLGPARQPVLFALLSPSGRPVQMTSDLRSFWKNTYPEIRKELRGRYPKHPWPEDPMAATPTHRTTRRR